MIKIAKRLSVLLALAALAVAAIGAGSAQASFSCFEDPLVDPAPGSQPGFGVADGCFDGSVSADALGAPATQAGAHPYSLSTVIDFNTRLRAEDLFGFAFDIPWPEEAVRDVLVDAPQGLVGNPQAVEQCTMEQLATLPQGAAAPICPAESQVGTITLRASDALSFPTFISVLSNVPLYSVVPPDGAAARFGFNLSGVVVTLDAELRGDQDYRISLNARNISEGLAVLGSDLTLWGTPADPSHDAERWCPAAAGPGCTAAHAEVPFLTLPTSCTPPGVGLETTLHTDSWFDPGDFKTASFSTHDPPGLADGLTPDLWGAEGGTEGCDKVPFDPEVSVKPTTRAASTPTGLQVDLTLPTEDDLISNLAQSHLKKAVVALPEGMTVNPSQADGVSACTLTQIGLDSTESPNCPDSSKIGTVEIDTPLLDHQVPGAVYLAAQNDNPFGSMLAMYIVADDPDSGVVIKLAGKIEPTASGQLISTFDNQPQLPFAKLHLELKSGPRAPLVTPSTCGTKTATADLSPWARPDEIVHLESSFQITSGPNGAPCANTDAERPFDPKLAAGSVNPLGGAKSPFTLRLSRNDGEQELSGLEVVNPPGFSAVLKGVPYCPEAALGGFPSPAGTGAAQLATPSCPAASQIGTLDTGAGAGPLPFHVGGKAYLAGPYKGAPLSLAFFVPALAGPFDLGTVMVRAAAHVDPTTAQVTVKSDPLPTILEGIPLAVRSVDVAIDRPGFAVNPTSCDVMAVKARVTSVQGTVATPQSRYQLLGCGELPFKPRLTFKLKGATKRGGYPALRAVLKMPEGSANIARTSVALPHSEFLAQGHIGTVCTRVQYAADACPPKSVYGHARAFSPLLDQPLEGPVYLRSSSNPLPDLVAALHGQIDVDLTGRIDSKDGGIRTTFATVPDAPVSKFVLTMAGGKKGLLENSTNLCARTNRATVLMDAHSGKVADSRPVLRSSCGDKATKPGKTR